MSERLQKVMARAGAGSRRQIETWIVEGRVKVNGKKVELGYCPSATDMITLDNKSVNVTTSEDTARVLMYHKPMGEICTLRDPEGRRTVYESIPKLYAGKWIGIGRLDYNTSGLYLFTNDGELANNLMHPRYRIEREYAVRVYGSVDNAILSRLQQGVKLEDGMARFERILCGNGDNKNQWYNVVIREGRTREVKRLWESQGVRVSRLVRIRFGTLNLPRELKAGEWVELSQRQISQLTQSE